jgi:hypothetical protein
MREMSMATRFIVQGTRADTGEAQQLLIEAEDVFEARQIAGIHGFDVSSVVPEETPSGAAQYARTAPMRPRRRSGNGVMKSVFAFVVVVCVLCGGVWFLISRGIVRVNFPSISPAVSSTQSVTTRTAARGDDILDKVSEVLATTKRKPKENDEFGVGADQEFEQAVSRALNCFKGAEYRNSGKSYHLSERGAYKDGISLLMTVDFPEARQMGNYTVAVTELLAYMKPSQTAQAAALQVGTYASFVFGRIDSVAIMVGPPDTIRIMVIVHDGEF